MRDDSLAVNCHRLVKLLVLGIEVHLHWLVITTFFFGAVLVERLRLIIHIVYWILRKDLLPGHVQALEKKASLDGGHHIILLLRDQIAGLHLEVLLVLPLGLLDVVAEGLLFDAGADHLLFILSELLVRHGWLLLLPAAGDLLLRPAIVADRVAIVVGVEVLLEVLSESELNPELLLRKLEDSRMELVN